MRMSLTIMIITLVTAGCAGLQPVPPGQLYVQKTLEAPGMNQEQLYWNSKLWITRNFRPYMAVWLYQRKTSPLIEYANEKQGILIATGTIPYPYKAFSFTEGNKAYWEVNFTLEVDVKYGKARITFSNLGIYVPKIWCGNIYSEWLGAYDKPLTEVEDMEAVRPVLTNLADRLGEFLMSPGTGERW